MTNEQEAAALAEIDLKIAQAIADDAKKSLDTTSGLFPEGGADADDLAAAELKYTLAAFDVDKATITLNAAKSRLPKVSMLGTDNADNTGDKGTYQETSIEIKKWS